MKKLISLCLILCPLLAGCASTQGVENQAHAISMGLDYQNEKITMTVQVPTIGGESGSGGAEKSKPSDYMVYSATAKDFPTAYDVLQATLPQELNLTQLKSIVISEAFARSERFAGTLQELFHVYALSGGAILVVSKTDAKAMLENQKAFIGSRLSMTVPAMLDYYSENGYIAKTSLSMLFAGCASVYSTGCTAYAGTSNDQIPDESAYLPGEMSREGDNKNEYMGSALFNRTKMVGVFTGRETQKMHFISGTDIHAAEFFQGQSLRITALKKPKIKIDLNASPIQIDITLRLRVLALIGFPDMTALARLWTEECEALIQKCQALGVEPFNFADRAALRFDTIDDWQAYDWLSAFSGARVNVKVELKGEK